MSHNSRQTCRFLSSVDGTQEGEMIQLQSTQFVSKNCLIPNWSLRTQNWWKVKVKKGQAGKAGGNPWHLLLGEGLSITEAPPSFLTSHQLPKAAWP